MVEEEKSKAKVLDLSGNFIKEIALPRVFTEEYRPDLIKRAVLAMQSNRLQPKGTDPLAGRRTSAESWGPGRGAARVPRITDGRRAARVPQAVGGRRAHPPKTEKVLTKKINKKERRKAIKSAIAATINPERVRNRGHRFSDEVELPIVIEDSFASLEKTSEVEEFLKTIGVWDDVLRAKERKVRAGKGKMRGRRYKSKKSILIVISREEELTEDKKITKSAENLPGVDVSYAEELNAELLAPGTHPGRLTIWTESSLTKLATME
ncbi:MAG TPA: 50S ribosomal protein L4 [Candidatus Bathyarchaeia archaeon]|nr:50S ribosomal protein L4 [Candidatus Bathyarchaeia archaeon]